jgi:hypothetical protein
MADDIAAQAEPEELADDQLDLIAGGGIMLSDGILMSDG